MRTRRLSLSWSPSLRSPGWPVATKRTAPHRQPSWNRSLMPCCLRFIVCMARTNFLGAGRARGPSDPCPERLVILALPT
jgi:hypothetical protein